MQRHFEKEVGKKYKSENLHLITKKFLDWSACPHKEVEYVKVSFLKTIHTTYLSGKTKSLDNMDFSFRVF